MSILSGLAYHDKAQVIKVNQILPIENTALWIYSKKIDQPEVAVYRSIFK